MKKLNFFLIGLVIVVLSLFAVQVSAATYITAYWTDNNADTLTVGLNESEDTYFDVVISTTGDEIYYGFDMYKEVNGSYELIDENVEEVTVEGWNLYTSIELDTSDYEVGNYLIFIFSNYGEAYEELYLTISDNNVPNAPSNPSPADGAIDVSINPTLTWESSDDEGDELSYLIYFESNSDTQQGIPGEDELFSSDTTLELSNLEYNTTYSWFVQVNEVDNPYNEIIGDTWTFTTGSEEVLNDVPIISNIPDQTVICGNQFSYQVYVTDDGNNLTYSDNTNLFDISNTGLISVNTLCDDVGNYDITITVEDEYGVQDTEEFRLTINDNDDNDDNDDDDDDNGVTYENQMVYGVCTDDNDGDNQGLRTVTLNVINPFNGQIVSTQQIVQSCQLNDDTTDTGTGGTTSNTNLGIVLLVAFLVLAITVPFLFYFYYRYSY